MVLSDFAETEWANVIEFYIQDGMHESIELKTAVRLRDSSFSESWFPSISHWSLVISPTHNYEQRTEFPLISIKGVSDGKAMLEVWRRYGDSNSFSRYDLHEDEVYERLLSFLESYKKASEI